MPRTFTSGQLCRRFGVLPWQIHQAIHRGFLPEPRRHGYWRVWTEDELPAVRAALIAAGYLREEVASAD